MRLINSFSLINFSSSIDDKFRKLRVSISKVKRYIYISKYSESERTEISFASHQSKHVSVVVTNSMAPQTLLHCLISTRVDDTPRTNRNPNVPRQTPDASRCHPAGTMRFHHKVKFPLSESSSLVLTKENKKTNQETSKSENPPFCGALSAQNGVHVDLGDICYLYRRNKKNLRYTDIILKYNYEITL